MSVPDDVKQDILLACRYGDLDDVQSFIKENGVDVLSEIRDESGNTVLHMISANGHIGKQ